MLDNSDFWHLHFLEMIIGNTVHRSRAFLMVGRVIQPEIIKPCLGEGTLELCFVLGGWGGGGSV